ncbi:DUF6087 family protein [Streptomyces sp. NBC_00572]|uniref:DUF6087 family protein n=1 Tax=Streptomyces sp. NBC_00572 TaxID=2903664 RepID=UPI00338D44BB
MGISPVTNRCAGCDAVHLRADEPRVLEEWDDFTYQVVGTAPNLVAAKDWVAELTLDDDPAA